MAGSESNDALNEYGIRLPCRTIEELQRFDNRLGEGEVFNGFARFFEDRCTNQSPVFQDQVRTMVVLTFSPKLFVELPYKCAPGDDQVCLKRFTNVMRIFNNLWGGLRTHDDKKLWLKTLLVFRSNTREANNKGIERNEDNRPFRYNRKWNRLYYPYERNEDVRITP